MTSGENLVSRACLLVGHSNAAECVHNRVVMSALNWHLVACGDFGNILLEIAQMVVALRKSDYSPHKVWRAVKRFVVCRAAWRFGETNPQCLFASIYHVLCLRFGFTPPVKGRSLWEHSRRFWVSKERMYRSVLPC
jgi:hypothetical protein